VIPSADRVGDRTGGWVGEIWNSCRPHWGVAAWALEHAAPARTGSTRDSFARVAANQKMRIVTALRPIFYSERHAFLGRSSPGEAWRGIEVLRGLEALQQVESTFQDKRFLLRSQLGAEASAALRAAGVAAPPTLRELP
jgi:hypothetical protein